MNVYSLIAGLLIMAGGAVLYLMTYKRSDRLGRTCAIVGLAILALGTYVAIGNWVFHAAKSER